MASARYTQRERHYRQGNVECGWCMSDERTWVTHIFAWLFAVTIFVFTYAVLVEGGGLWHAVGGFVIGFMLLFYLYGQNLDSFYLHIGDKLKIGGDAFDPDAERVTIEYDDERRE